MNTSQKITIPRSGPFFCREKQFYKDFFRLMIVLVLQNIITYSVNVLDNLMLGSYSQTALSGAAVVNQIQFILQNTIGFAFGQGLVILASQYFGQKRHDEVQKVAGTATISAVSAMGAFFAVAMCTPMGLVRIFTDQTAIQAEALIYLKIIRYSYIPFIITSMLLSALRSTQVVSVAFKLSVMSLFINAGINYCLIFGHFGAPELGIQGAAIGTVTARIIEMLVLILYLKKSRKLPVRFALSKMLCFDRQMLKDYFKLTVPCIISEFLFACIVAIQTVVFGHMNADAIAANAVNSTFYQYCKMAVIGTSAATSAIIGRDIGKKAWDTLRSKVRTLQVLFLVVGILAAIAFVCVTLPVVGLYDLTPQAVEYAHGMTWILAGILIASGYQMPVLIGIIQGGGDSRYVMILDIILALCMAIPLALLGLYVFGFGVYLMLFLMNIDQLIKCVLNFFKVSSYSWVKTLTK